MSTISVRYIVDSVEAALPFYELLGFEVAMHPTLLAICLAVVMAAHAPEAEAQDRWDVAEQAIRRLPPDSFPGLPERVREEMRGLGCLVPQGSEIEHAHNVVAGRFASADQVDWAFLCSRDGVNSIHVLWGGEKRCETPIGPAEDRRFLQELVGGSIGFSRRLMPAERDRMVRLGRAFGGPPVPVVWHQGLEDYFEGKASVIRLCVEGEWITLAGID